MPVTASNPTVEEREEGEHEEEQAAEETDVEQHAGGVGGQMQVSRLLLVGHHGAGIGVDDTFLHAAARLRLVLRRTQAHNLDEMCQ